MTVEQPATRRWQGRTPWFCLSAVGVLSILTFNFVQRGSSRFYELDEGAWIYSGYFYHLAFQKRDLQSPDWKHRDCLDHPPVAKYLFGAVAASDHYVVDSPDLKAWWFDSCFHLDLKTMTETIRAEVPQSTFARGRLVCTALFAASCMVVFWIGAAVFAPWTAALAAVLLSACPIVLDSSILIRAEAPFCLLLVLLVAAQIGWFKHCGCGLRKISWRAICIGLLIAFLANTKLNGLLGLPCAMVVIAAGLLTRRTLATNGEVLTRRRALADVLVSAALVTVTFLIAAIAINPSLYSDQIEFVKGMFERRWNHLEFQTKYLYLNSLPTRALMTAGVVRGLFFANDWLFEWWSVPGLLFFFLLGVGGMPAAFARNRRAALVVVVNFAVWGSATACTYRMDWNRYLMPLVPFVMLLSAAGVVHAFWLFRNPGRTVRRFAWVLFAVAVTAGLTWVQGRWTIENHMDPDRKQLVDAYREAARLRPDRAGAYIRYADALFVFQGKLDEAKAASRQGLKLNPNYAEGYQTLGAALISENRPREALDHLRQSLELSPENPYALTSLADALLMLDELEAQGGQPPETTARLDEAIRLYRHAARVHPDGPYALMRLAQILATYPNLQSRRPREAIELARKASANMGGEDPALLMTLALAHASGGQFDLAVATAEKALALLKGSSANSEVVKRLQMSRDRFKRKQPPLPPGPYLHMIMGK